MLWRSTAELAARFTVWWIDNRPFSRAARARRKAKREARREARRTSEGGPMQIPKHFVTGTGITVLVVGVAMQFFGISECEPGAVADAAQNCLAPGTVEKIAASMSTLGTAIVTMGKLRSAKREAKLEAKASNS